MESREEDGCLGGRPSWIASEGIRLPSELRGEGDRERCIAFAFAFDDDEDNALLLLKLEGLLEEEDEDEEALRGGRGLEEGNDEDRVRYSKSWEGAPRNDPIHPPI